MAGKSKKRSGRSRGAEGAHAKASGKANPSQMKTSTKVIVIVFAVIMAASMMLPSFVSIFASQAQGSEDSSTSADSSSSDASSASDSSSADSSADASLEGVPESLQPTASKYAPTVSSLESKLSSDPNNLATLLNLAQDYMSWGYTSLSSSTTDEETTYSTGLLQKAVEYYDRYLALNDSSAAKVDRALCEFYAGSTEAAQADLEQVTVDDPGYGPAWANLGMLYEYAGDTDKATEAYQKAVDADPDDEYGAKSFANQRLIQIKASSTSSSSSTSDSTSVPSTSEQGLSDTLSSKSGIGF
ncbi:MAG: tetratricopeptide repeat protein [Olsenella sp.]|jgi:tetratricopeptide (TPR) repeat protein